MLQSAFLGTALSARPVAVARPSQQRTCTPQALLDFIKKAPKKVSKPRYETVTLRPSFAIPTVLLGAAAASHFAHGPAAVEYVAGVLGAFLAFQGNRVKFVFDDEALEVLIGAGAGKQSDNVVVGGRNRWAYSSFVEWQMWWPAFPVLVYFKETQTKEEGQIHFFPILFDGRQLYEVMSERCGPRKS